jgi:hypothetical protein
MGGAGLGETAGSNLANTNTSAALQQSKNLLSAAGAEGSAGLAGANAWSNAAKGIVSGLSSFGGNPSASSALSGLFGGGPSGGPVDLSSIGSGYGSSGTVPGSALAGTIFGPT